MFGPMEYVFPNEAVEWTILIVTYPFVTGLVAGAFIVSALVYVFNQEKFKPVGRLALITSLVFLFLSFLPLVAHLHQPQRAIEIMTRPNFSSAMAAFGYIYLFYLIVAMVETIFLFRVNSVQRRDSSSGILKIVYSLLSLGTKDISGEAMSRDMKIVRLLAVIGVPTAVLFHGYVGFIFGAVKANPIWSTPLMPVIFLMSAIVSGVALLIVVYVGSSYFSGKKPLESVVSSLSVLLGWFVLIDVSFHGLEELYRAYERTASWQIVEQTLFGQLYWTHIWGEFILGSFIPLALIAIPRIRRSAKWMTLTSILVVGGVFSMRWNVVIGAQLISRSGQGFLTYTPPLIGRESVLSVVAIFSMSLFLLILLTSIFPWRDETKEVRTLG